MPTLNEIQDQIVKRKNQAQDEVRRGFLRQLAKYTGRDTILYASAFTSTKGLDIPASALSVITDDMPGFMSALNGLKGDKLDIILHSPGGAMEAADQIIQYLRAKYDDIRAIVPQNAMSAATMIACGCDSIVMGKHSAIGPIDPQVTFPTANGYFTAPAQSILDEFDQAKQEIASDPSSAPLWISRIQSYPHGFLSLCKTTLELAEDKVAEWLEAYMFKGDSAAASKARAIADWLADANVHKTHGRPINFAAAKAKGLKIDELEADQKLQDLVLSVHHSAMVTFLVTPCVKIIENQNGRGLYTQAKVTAVPAR
jgi:hypothetical protein